MISKIDCSMVFSVERVIGPSCHVQVPPMAYERRSKLTTTSIHCSGLLAAIDSCYSFFETNEFALVY